MTSEITNVDLRLLRKVRGVAPLSRYALRDDGSVMVAVPDTMEVRTLHLVRCDAGGASRVEETYGVETLRRSDLAPGGGGIGITDDDLYLFRESRKSRFLPDRRASYADISLSEDGKRFIAAFTDMLASGHAVAWGDIGGRALWTKDMPFAITRVAVDRGANFMAVAGENGDLHLLDTSRDTTLRFRAETAIRAVATIGLSRTVFATEGGIGAIDADGHLLWFHETDGVTFEIALDTTARTVAALIRRDENAGSLLFLSADGLPVWDVEYDDSRPTGLSLAADGAFAGVTLRDGSLCIYELTYGQRTVTAAGIGAAVGAAQSARATGDLTTAVRLLQERLLAAPADLDAADELISTLGEYRTRSITASETAEAVGDWAAADQQLGTFLESFPIDGEMVQRRAELRARWAASARSLGEAALSGGDGPEAEARLSEAILAAPLDRDARALLAAARSAATTQSIVRARTAIASGDFAAALAALTDAQSRSADSSEVAGLLREARIGQAVNLGNSLYQDRQYAAAVFQFKKALRLDPGNNDAAQKVRYCQNFLQDTQLNDRFTRLE